MDNVEKSTPLLKCTGISKSFPGVLALNNVDFELQAGSVHGLVGENGAGKSTLAKIIAGVYQPDSGLIELKGESVKFRNAESAIQQKIITIHQDLNLIQTLSVIDNIFLNNENVLWKSGFIHQRKEKITIKKLLNQFSLEIDPQILVSDLPNDLKKMIQIMKAVYLDPKIILMDEPTSSLTDTEVRLVLDLTRSLSKKGVGILFISHYLPEIFDICDTITVLRDGSRVSQSSIKSVTIDQIVTDMLGKSHQKKVQRNKKVYTENLLSVKNLTVKNQLNSIDLELNRGEILGVTGLTGSGANILGKAIIGYEEINRISGEFKIGDQQVGLRNPSESLKNGITLLTNDRLREGILADFPIYENICLPTLDRYWKGLRGIDYQAMKKTGENGIDRLNIRTPSVYTSVKQLSGGNQQKVLVAKWLETNPRIFILDEPTIGIDVGSKAEIREIIEEIADSGVGIILITKELEELESLCDRVLVMFRGKVVAEYICDAICGEEILKSSMSGGRVR